MSDNNNVVIGGGGILFVLWLVDVIFLWLNPSDVPKWVMLILQIFFWLGAIVTVGMLMILVIAVIVFALSDR